MATLTAIAYFGYVRLRRRQRDGARRIVKSLPVNAAWWHEHGKVWWHDEERHDAATHERHEGELLYVALGDSAAQGVGASHPHHSYVGKIAAHLRHATGASVQVVNLSVSGARLREALATQVPEMRNLHPDILTVAIGANDMADFDPARFETEVRELFDALPGNAIVADVPCFFFGEAEKRVRVANKILRRCAAEHGFTIAPLYARTKRQGVARVALNQVAADYFHPNNRGYQVWASAFIPLVDHTAAVHAHAL